MKNYQLTNLLAFSAFCSVLTLAGCQSPKDVMTTQTTIASQIPLDPLPSEPQPIQARKLQWASGYDWQLIEARNPQGQPIMTQSANPINLKIEPSTLTLSQGCQSYSVDLYQSSQPFPYSGSQLSKAPSSCHKNDHNQSHISDIPTLIKNRYFDFNLEAIAPQASVKHQPNTVKQLALKIKNGNTLIFKGTPKAFATPEGLTINNELLERYHWRLINAVSYDFDNQGKPVSKKLIGDFYHPDFPISLDFFSNADYQTISFSANCNGTGAPYILTQDYQLRIGLATQTMKSCGSTGDRIESHLYKLLSQSSSQLKLTLQPQSSTAKADFPRYLLTQKMESGETLVWESEARLNR
ncbi:META domain-containing protein [Psychrobacter ciconiae]|uniref:META domain-containing protein n=1 Tax=Psychrobacter ciconiae TaxID=1553449 RepID=UPI00191A79F7|nr:META domain-containing protein [Psychrobacter ciconiae]